jgi:hypothetical protein
VTYQIVTNDLPSVLAEVKRRLSTGETRISNALDPKSGQMSIYREFGQKVSRANGQPAPAKPGLLETYCQLVFGDPVAGADDAFNAWYDKVYVPNMMAAPGFVLVQRTVVSAVQMEPLIKPSRYLTLFRIQTTDLRAALRHRGRSAEPPAALDRARTFVYTYRAIGPLLRGDEVRTARAGTPK